VACALAALVSTFLAFFCCFLALCLEATAIFVAAYNLASFFFSSARIAIYFLFAPAALALALALASAALSFFN